jgi:tetratricopeptide (TPR) repeat protein
VKSLELADSLNSEVEKATVLTNLARVSLKKNNAAEAAERVEQAIALAREATKQSKGEGEEEKNHAQRKVRANMVLARALALAGEIATSNKDNKKADNHFTEAIRIVEAAQSGEGDEESSDIYQRYAQVLAGRGQHEQASKYYERAYKAVTRRY